MQLKANLHFHSAIDSYDEIKYTTKGGIDEAARFGFHVLAITSHDEYSWTEDLAEYARTKGILLLPGIELNVSEGQEETGRHVVLLGCTKDSERIHTFEDLATYKEAHPEIFVLAPHPYFYGNFSLKEYLEKYIPLFDAIEHSWFYTKIFNRNRRAIEIAKRFKLPLIATSDTHFLFDAHLNRNYVLIEATERTPDALFTALREGNFTNVTSPSLFFRHFLFAEGGFLLARYTIHHPRWKKIFAFLGRVPAFGVKQSDISQNEKVKGDRTR